jgi:hypothetical protein
VIQGKAVQAFSLNNVVCFMGAYRSSCMCKTMIVNILWPFVNKMCDNLV